MNFENNLLPFTLEKQNCFDHLAWSEQIKMQKRWNRFRVMIADPDLTISSNNIPI